MDMYRGSSKILLVSSLIALMQTANLPLGNNSVQPVHAKSNQTNAKPTDSAKASQSNVKEGDKAMAEIYTFKAKTLDGKEIGLDQFKGDVLLIVNTASKCGFTPQYAGLEALHKQYANKGLKVLGFPCNQFGAQEPGDSGEIHNFCQKNYGVDFQMFDKVEVNGKSAHPLYKYLTSAAPGVLGSEAIKWNFTKFLVDRNGNVVKRYAPDVAPEKIAPDIEKQLSP
jgi:glutathione peroxidase